VQATTADAPRRRTYRLFLLNTAKVGERPVLSTSFFRDGGGGGCVEVRAAVLVEGRMHAEAAAGAGALLELPGGCH
jgi:hypothetical protein